MYGNNVQTVLSGWRHVLIMGRIDAVTCHHLRQFIEGATKLGDGVIRYKTYVMTAGKETGSVFRIAGRQEYFEIADIINDLIEVVDISPCPLIFCIEYTSIYKNFGHHGSMYW